MLVIYNLTLEVELLRLLFNILRIKLKDPTLSSYSLRVSSSVAR